MAAYVARNFGYREESGSGSISKFKLILKEELRKNWYVYGTGDGTIFRPYPVFDANGYCCPPLGDPDDPIEAKILPDSFAALRVALYAGMEKKLEFIDSCSDIDKYNTQGASYLKTPYEYLVKALQQMSPTKNDPTKTRDGYEQPRALKEISRFGVPVSANCILCRGALLMNGGPGGSQPVTARAAIGGILYSAVICIRQNGAVSRFYEMLKTPKEDSQPLSPVNNILSSMFSVNGCALKTQNQGQGGKNNYTTVKQLEPTFSNKFAEAFKCQPTDQAYWTALRSTFGPYQNIADIFNEMTVEEMVNVLKDNYPISWLWYAWRDTPYSQFFSPEEKQQALRDPEMIHRLGAESSAEEMGKAANDAIRASEVTYQVKGPKAAPAQQQQQPTWNGPAYSGYQATPSVSTTSAGYPVQPAQGVQEPEESNDDDMMAELERKYSSYGKK